MSEEDVLIDGSAPCTDAIVAVVIRENVLFSKGMVINYVVFLPIRSTIVVDKISSLILTMSVLCCASKQDITGARENVVVSAD